MKDYFGLLMCIINMTSFNIHDQILNIMIIFTINVREYYKCHHIIHIISICLYQIEIKYKLNTLAHTFIFHIILKIHNYIFLF